MPFQRTITKSDKLMIRSFKLPGRLFLVKDYIHAKAVLEYTGSVKGPTLITAKRG